METCTIELALPLIVSPFLSIGYSFILLLLQPLPRSLKYNSFLFMAKSDEEGDFLKYFF